MLSSGCHVHLPLRSIAGAFRVISWGSLVRPIGTISCAALMLTLPGARIGRHLRNDSTDNVRQLRGESGNRLALRDFVADLGDALVEIDIGGNDRSGSVRVFPQRLGRRVFNASDPGTFQLGVHVDADDRGIAQNNAMGATYAGNTSNEFLQVSLAILLRHRSVYVIFSHSVSYFVAALHPLNLVRMRLILRRG